MKPRVKLASALALLVAAQACNALVGIEDVHLRDDASNGAAAGQGPTPADGGVGALGGSSAVGGSQAQVGGEPMSQAGDASSGSGGDENLAGASSGGANGGEGGAMGGAGGEGATGGETQACPSLGEDRGGGKLKLIQFPPLLHGRGRLAITGDGKNAYNTTWGDHTQHYARDPKTGMLTPKSTAGVYNGEMVVLSPDFKHLYVDGANATQFYDILIGADGTIANTPASNPPGYSGTLDGERVGETIFLASGASIRTIEKGVYTATNRAVPGNFDDAITLSRIGDYLYWTEYARGVFFPADAPAKVARMRLHCDGTTGPREAFASGRSPFQVAGCGSNTRYLYVAHPAIKLPDQPGYIDVIDLATCAGDFSSCVPVKKLTDADIAGMVDPSSVHMAPDCSTLYMTHNVSSAGNIVVLGLNNPKAPAVLQTFAQDGTYDGVKMTGGISGWHMTWFDGYLYVSNEFGEGISVFKSEH